MEDALRHPPKLEVLGVPLARHLLLERMLQHQRRRLSSLAEEPGQIFHQQNQRAKRHIPSTGYLLHPLHLLRIRPRPGPSLGHYSRTHLEHRRPNYPDRLESPRIRTLVCIRDYLLLRRHVECPVWLDE